MAGIHAGEDVVGTADEETQGIYDDSGEEKLPSASELTEKAKEEDDLFWEWVGRLSGAGFLGAIIAHQVFGVVIPTPVGVVLLVVFTIWCYKERVRDFPGGGGGGDGGGGF